MQHRRHSRRDIEFDVEPALHRLCRNSWRRRSNVTASSPSTPRSPSCRLRSWTSPARRSAAPLASCPNSRMTSTFSRWSPSRPSVASDCAMPSTPFSGVRISWLIEARKFDFATVAASACCFASISASSCCFCSWMSSIRPTARVGTPCSLRCTRMKIRTHCSPPFGRYSRASINSTSCERRQRSQLSRTAAMSSSWYMPNGRMAWRVSASAPASAWYCGEVQRSDDRRSIS